jgi:hypothetical protein
MPDLLTDLNYILVCFVFALVSVQALLLYMLMAVHRRKNISITDYPVLERTH